MKREIHAVTLSLNLLSRSCARRLFMSYARFVPPLIVAPWLFAQGLGSAAAADLPVVNINDEIGLSFSDLIKNYKEYVPSTSPAFDRENGAVPGFDVSGSFMTDILGVSHIYGALQFRFTDGTIAYTGSSQAGQPVSQTNGITQKDVRLELGKGFLLNDRLMIIPVVQFGYHIWNRNLLSYYEDYSNLYVGAALHLDYSVTPRLVARFRAGLATTASPQIYFGDDDVTTPLGVRPVYQMGGGLDYAVTDHIHLTADADFSHYSYGEGPRYAVARDGSEELSIYNEPSSATNDLYVEGGLAYRF